jgi:hypothetical protein
LVYRRNNGAHGACANGDRTLRGRPALGDVQLRGR